MEKSFLTVKTFYDEVIKRKDNIDELKDFFINLTKNYNIPVVKDPQKNKCPYEYPSNYIVNQSKKRFTKEISKSKFISHWDDLCQYTEISMKLRLIYNLLNIKKENLINLLEKITIENKTESIKLENSGENKNYLKEVLDLLGLTNDDIFKIKINNPTYKKENKKVLIHLNLIINLNGEYPKNIISCPLGKISIGNRNTNTNKNQFYFVCHKDNMIKRLKVDKLLLSVWLSKNTRNNKTTTKIKIDNSYIADNFPYERENGSLNFLNDFINEIMKNKFYINMDKYLESLKKNIENNLFYVIETHNPVFKNININLKKNTKKTQKKLKKQK
jgi:hypothetical protein